MEHIHLNRKEIAMERTFGLNIPRASEGTIDRLLAAGILYIGADNQLHVTENAPTTPTKVE